MQYRWPTAKRAEKAGADAKMADMWHLENTGSYYRHPGMKAGEDLRVKPVWNQGWRGEGIRIAILDDGLEMTHEDLYPNIGTGNHNFRKYRTALDERFGRPGVPVGHQDYPVPCDATDSHGTAVAGIVAARDHNQVGGAGVAPRATLVGLNVLSSNLLDDTLDALTYDLGKNHIYNSSWGPTEDGHLHQAVGGTRLQLNATLERGLKTGRNGRGAIYVFSGGNGAENGDYSSADGMVSSLGVITACASNAAGLRAPYSERGANLTVCAPTGGAVEDDEDQRYLLNTVTPGLNNTYREFAGTSAAAPMVSGVVALMLQRNPSLTWRDVPLILARTARRIDTAHGGWKEHKSPLGAGNGAYDTIHYSHSYGFGVANAEAAVALAGQWQSVGGSDSLKQCGPYRITVDQDIPEAGIITTQAASTTPRAIIGGNTQDQFFKTLLKEAGRLDYNRPPQGAMRSSVEVPQDCNIQHIEHVDVGITVTGSDGKGEHPNAGDLQIALQSPGNRVSTLLVPHPCTTTTVYGGDEVQAITACTGLQNFHFGVRRHLEEPVVSGRNRTWNLGVVDRVKGATGKLKDWEITFYGR